MAKRRDAVGYVLPGQDDEISQINDNTNDGTNDGNTQGRVDTELGSRVLDAGVRLGPVGERGMPSGSSSQDPQGQSQPATLDVATSSSSSDVPRPSQDQTQTQAQDPGRDHGFDRIIHEKVHDFVPGIPRLAAFVDSSDHNAVHRRFGRLTARVLIHRESELTRLETKLDELDRADELDGTMKKRLSCQIFNEDDGVQEALLAEIEEKLCKYHDLLLREARVRALGQAPANHHEQLLTYMINRKPLDDGPDNFIFHVDDFVSVAKPSESSTRFTVLLESLLKKWPGWLGKWLFQSKKEEERIDDPYVDQYSPTKVGRGNKIIAVFLAVCVLLIPVMLLFLRHMSKEAMAWLVFAFVLFFCVQVTVLTEARPLEIFVATAAYAAVLVTFLGNLAHA